MSHRHVEISCGRWRWGSPRDGLRSRNIRPRQLRPCWRCWLSRRPGRADRGARWRVVAGSGAWCGDLRDRVAGVFVRRVWIVSSQLFVLRSEFSFRLCSSGISGADLSSPRPAAEASVWMFARLVLCFAGDAGGTVRIVALVEEKAPLVSLRWSRRRLLPTTFCSMHRFIGGRRDCRSVRGMRGRVFRSCASVWR